MRILVGQYIGLEAGNIAEFANIRLSRDMRGHVNDALALLDNIVVNQGAGCASDLDVVGAADCLELAFYPVVHGNVWKGLPATCVAATVALPRPDDK